MQAASTVRGIGISRSAGGFVIGLMAALVLGGVGGFTARSLTVEKSAVRTTSTVTHQQSQGGPQSDLTRALPTAAQVDPADWWKVDGIVPPTAPSAPTHQVRGTRDGVNRI